MAGKQIIINCEQLESRVALLRNGRLEDYEIERKSNEVMPGSIYLGKIVNLEPSLEAAFVDIGCEKNAFLHYKDMLPASDDQFERIEKKVEEEKKVKKRKSRFSEKLRALITRKKNDKDSLKKQEIQRRNKKITVRDIPNLFPVGTRLLIQVTKGPIGTKGPRVSTNITIPGRYLVLLPYSDHVGLSTKISDKKERERLRGILKELDIPEGIGLICRTVAEGRKKVFFQRDLDMLLELWHQVEVAMETPNKPKLVYREPTLVERTARDLLTDDINEIIIDSGEDFKHLQEFLTKIMGPKFSEKIKYYRRAKPIFEQYNVKKQIQAIFQRTVNLPSGGYLCIDETEALIAIDINTGRGRNYKGQPEAILETNLEAAEEIARQLRLRNIGGLVVIDFIDMRKQKDREKVARLMRKLTKEDKARTKILPISRLGLMEMTRQREHESLKDAVYDLCPYCNGGGRIKSAISMSVEIQRSLQEVLRRHRREKDFAVQIMMHPTILERLKNKDRDILLSMENEYGKNLTFRADDSLHHEDFKIINPTTQKVY
jgi:ribonuclease G